MWAHDALRPPRAVLTRTFEPRQPRAPTIVDGGTRGVFQAAAQWNATWRSPVAGTCTVRHSGLPSREASIL